MPNKFEETFTNIADAIREKTGTTDKIKPEDMASKISAISSGGMKTYFDLMSNSTHIGWLQDGKFTYEELSKAIKYNDTENLKDMQYMFDRCYNIRTIPLINTSNCTNMTAMFSGDTMLESIPLLDTSKVTSIQLMFYGCSKLISIPLLDTSMVVQMWGIFQGCSSIKIIPALNCSKVTASNNLSNIFNGCSSLEEIHMTGMKVSFDISSSTKFTESALVEILNNLEIVSTTQILTIGTANLAKLTDEEKKIATDKGWSLT